jgi:hypothetical protein
VEAALTVLAVWAADELQIAGLTATDVTDWMQLKIRVGSGSHWSLGVEDACDRRGAEINRSQFEVVEMFPEVFMGPDPGFTCIVGNPPFGRLPEELENSENIGPMSCFSFGSRQEPTARWQYPRFVEALYKLTQRGSRSAIVTPLNLAYGQEFAYLRSAIETAPRRSTFTFFDRSPDALFGDKVKTRNVVLLVGPSENKKGEIWATQLLRWTRSGRAHLWEQIRPTQLTGIEIRRLVPKVGTPLELECWKALRFRLPTLSSAILPSNAKSSQDTALHVYSTAYNWLPAFRHMPETIAPLVSPCMRTYHFRTAREADVIYSCLVSSIAFWLWTVESDGFHLTRSFILGLPFVPDMFPTHEAQLLSELGRAHDAIIRSSPTIKSNAGLRVLNFNRQSGAQVSCQIDEVLVRVCSLSPAFLELVHERVHGLVYAGREQTRATTSKG